MAIDLSVIICTHNRYDVLQDAIASIDTQECPYGKYELIIVDNSTDVESQKRFVNSLDISCQHKFLIESTPGLSRARNIGVRAASATIVAFMDDDAQPTAHWVSQIIETMHNHPQAGIAGGPVRPIWPVPRPPWLHQWLEGYLTIVDRGSELRPLKEGEWLAGTNIIFRRDLLISAGLFNENLGRIGKLLLSNEELSVSTKIASMGYQSIYDPKIEMFHRVHADRINHAWMRRRVFWQIVSDVFSDPESETQFEQDVARILDYLSRLPAKDRGLSGLFFDFDSPELFHEQTQALATLVRLIALNGQDWRAFLETRIP